jgi:hypothetical protein
MPKVVKGPVSFPGRGRKESVDWNLLTDGKPYRLEPGKDFSNESSTSSVQSAAHQAAARRGMKARTTVDGVTVLVQFYTVQS